MIWFWCDSRANIGLGHVVRCLALAQWAARRGEASRFVVPQMWSGLERFVANYDFEFEVAETPPLVGRNDVLVIDGYDFVIDVAGTEARTVLIDDLGDRDPAVDVVVNPNIYAPDLAYSADLTLLGSNFTLLRPEFVDARQTVPPVQRDVERIFVMLGGVDPTNETHRVLAALERAEFSGRVDLVTARDDVGTVSPAGFELVIHRSIASPAPLMQAADLAICAAGGSTWELACIGVPAIQIVVADNQRMIGDWLRKHDAAIVLDAPADDVLLDEALLQLSDLDTRLSMRARARLLVDGLGASRVLDTILL